MAPIVGCSTNCSRVTREVHVFQIGFHWLPSFPAICCLFHDPEFIRSRSKGVAELLDENGVDGCRNWDHPGRPGNV